ncbi:MAG: molybdopterin-dependent oxidoreductase, partial [Alphaproteobacteria bacterium]
MRHDLICWRKSLIVHPTKPDTIRQTTCYMCACRCGINVHLRDGKIRYIEGNRDHPINQGVLCAKGAAGIMQHTSPARLEKPLLRVGARGENKFKQIEWSEALDLAAKWLGEVRKSDPKKLGFYTGRDQSQALTGFWAQNFGTPNFAAHGGFCSVNMAAAGIYTIGGAFWEFGQPDWERTKLLIMFGVAEDHDSNPIKIGLSTLKRRGAKFVSINPVQTGYSAIADQWIGVRPGTDGLLILAIIHELFRTRNIDLDYLVRYTNAPWLVIESGPDEGLFARDGDGTPLVFDRKTGAPVSHAERGITPALTGTITLDDGVKARPVFDIMAQTYLNPAHAPRNVAAQTGIDAATITALAAEIARVAFKQEITIEQPWVDWKGEAHDCFIGRPVSFHAMRGISAHSNGFQTCRALHVLQILLGSIDCPGGFRFKPPYPKPAHVHPKPAGKPSHFGPEMTLRGAPLGYPQGPEDLAIDADGNPTRLDKAFSWEAPLGVHGMMHMAIPNAHAGDPYTIDVLFMYMANMAWNSSMNTGTV